MTQGEESGPIYPDALFPTRGRQVDAGRRRDVTRSSSAGHAAWNTQGPLLLVIFATRKPNVARCPVGASDAVSGVLEFGGAIGPT